MRMLFLFASFCCLSFQRNVFFASSLEVPAILWNIKGNALSIPSVPAFVKENIYEKWLMSVFRDDAKILVYAINELSLEDFSAADRIETNNSTLQGVQAFLDSQNYTFLSYVTDPAARIRGLECGIQEIFAKGEVDGDILKSISEAFDASCAVILHVPQFGFTNSKGATKSIFKPAFDKFPNIVGVFTGLKSSWGEVNEDHFRLRTLLEDSSGGHDNITVKNCFKMFAFAVTIYSGKNTLKTQPPGDKGKSSCDENKADITLSYKTDGKSTVELSFSFAKKSGSWYTKSASVKIDKESNELNGDLLSAPMGYSFACAELVLQNPKLDAIVVMENMQIQALQIEGSAYGPAVDCVSFLTIPMWSGIIVGLVYIGIVYYGISALYTVGMKTIDRFDDPKSQTVSVQIIPR